MSRFSTDEADASFRILKPADIVRGRKKKSLPVPTSNQADQTITYYQDASGYPTDRAVAFAAEVIECRGEVEVFRTYGVLT